MGSVGVEEELVFADAGASMDKESVCAARGMSLKAKLRVDYLCKLSGKPRCESHLEDSTSTPRSDFHLPSLSSSHLLHLFEKSLCLFEKGLITTSSIKLPVSKIYSPAVRGVPTLGTCVA